MTLTHIKVFCSVCELGSMSKTAIKLNMTQPGVSRMIAELESEYKVKLFLRKNRKLYLTSYGRQCYKDGKKVLLDVETMRLNIHMNEPMPALNIGCSTGIGSLVMPEACKLFRDKYPNCNLYISEGTSIKIHQGVMDGEYSIGFVQELIPEPRLVHKVFCGDTVMAVCSPSYKTKNELTSFALKDIADEKLIMTSLGTGIRNVIELYAASMNVTVAPCWNCSSGHNAKALAEAGLGVAILSDKTVAASIKEKRLRALPVDFELKRDFYQIWLNDSILSVEEKYFLQICSEIGKRKMLQ